MTRVEFLTPRELESAPLGVIHQKLRWIMRALVAEWRAGDLEPQTLVKAWAQCEFPLSYLPAATWRAMFNEVGYLDWKLERGTLVYGIPAQRPDRPPRLYRGVAASRLARRMAVKHTGLSPELGWSWSSDMGQARECAVARDPRSWAVYRADVPPEAILARMPAYAEYVIDTSKLPAPPELIRHQP